MTSKTTQFLQSAFAKVASFGLAVLTTLHTGMLGSNIAILNGATFDNGWPIFGAGVASMVVGLIADRKLSRKFSHSKPKYKWGARAALAVVVTSGAMYSGTLGNDKTQTVFKNNRQYQLTVE